MGPKKMTLTVYLWVGRDKSFSNAITPSLGIEIINIIVEHCFIVSHFYFIFGSAKKGFH